MGNFEAATNGDLNIKHEGFHHTAIIKAYQSGVDVFAHADFKQQTWWCSQKRNNVDMPKQRFMAKWWCGNASWFIGCLGLLSGSMRIME